MIKYINGEPVEMTEEETTFFEESRLPHCVLVDGEWVFDASSAIVYLDELTSRRRSELESGGVVYTHTAAKTYQTGPVPIRPDVRYERDYQGLVVAGLGSPIKALDNTFDTFSAEQVAELWGRIVSLASAINVSALILKGEAQAVTTIEEYETVKAKINGDDDWPTTPYPEA